MADIETSYEDRDGIIWMNGSLIPWRQARLHLLTHTLHYGTGVFEGIRAYKTPRGTCIFRLQAHLDRLLRSAEVLHMQLPYSGEVIAQAMCEVVRENDLQEAYIRPICFFGSEDVGLRASGLSVHVAVAAWEWPRYLGDDKVSQGISLKTAKMRRMADSYLNEVKASGPYLMSVMATTEAKAAGADEALMLDQNDHVAECSGQNIFMVKNGQISTPLTDNCLPGITRASVIDLAAEMGLTVQERHIDLDELKAADEVLVTGTATEVAPVSQIDDTHIGNGKMGDITAKLQKTYNDQVKGLRNNFSEWLTPVQPEL